MKSKLFLLFIGILSGLSLFWQCSQENNGITQNGYINAELSGIIIDKYTQLPIESVRLTTIPETQEVYTDTAGRFSIINLKAGDLVLIISKQGYLSDSSNIKLADGEKKEISRQLVRDPAFAEISLQTSLNYYSYNYNGVTLIPFYIKNYTDSTIYYAKCGGTAVFATDWKVNGIWSRTGWWGSPCLAIYLWETTTLLPYTIINDTLYVTSKDTFRFVVPIYYDSKTDTLISNEFIVQ